jgi:hypothetical protein
MSTALPHLLTAHEVAQWLGQSARRVERMARRGEIPSIGLPDGSRVYDEAELAAWLRSRRQSDAEGVSRADR